MMRIRKNDNVIILTGKDEGKRGTVIEVLPKKGKIIVKGIGMVVRHYKARRQGESSMIKEQEGALEVSNAMPICTSCHRPCRVNFVVAESGKKNRVCNHCKQSF